MINEDALKYHVNNKKFICFDFEGNLNLFFGTPFQLGYVIYEGRNIVSEHDYYIKWPDLQISQKVKEITRYSPNRMEKEGRNPKEVFSEFIKYLNNPEYLIVGANILNFDTVLLYNCLKRLDLNPNYNFLKRIYDVNAIFKGYKLELKPDHDNFLAWQYSMNNYRQRGLKSNVKYVAKEFGIDFDETKLHEGLYDCLVTTKNFFELIKRIDVK